MSSLLHLAPTPTPPDWAQPCRNGHCDTPAVYQDPTTGGWYETRGGLCTPCGAVARAERDREATEGLLASLRLPRKLQGLSLSRTIEPNAEELKVRRTDEAAAARMLRDRARESQATAIVGPTLATVDRLRAWKPPACVFLAGPVGSGKSHLAAALLQDHVRRTMDRGLFVSESDLARNVRRRAAKREVEDLALEAERTGLLLLDDLSTSESAKGWQRDLVEDLICYRYNAGAPVIITSNVPLDGIGEAYGARVESRIREMAEGFLLTVSGVDWRA